jgi:hypothetical protein
MQNGHVPRVALCIGEDLHTVLRTVQTDGKHISLRILRDSDGVRLFSGHKIELRVTPFKMTAYLLPIDEPAKMSFIKIKQSPNTE